MRARAWKRYWRVPRRFGSVRGIATSFRRAATAMQTAVIRDDIIAFLDADKAVDRVIGAASGNPYATRLAAPLQTHSRRFWFRLRRSGDLLASMERHVGSIDAIIAQDAEAAASAARALIAHLRGVAS